MIEELCIQEEDLFTREEISNFLHMDLGSVRQFFEDKRASAIHNYSQAAKLRWEDPEYRSNVTVKMTINGIRRSQTTEGHRHLENLKLGRFTPEGIENHKHSLLAYFNTDEGKIHQDKFLTAGHAREAREKTRKTFHKKGKTYTNSSSQFKGVTWISQSQSWKAEIRVYNRRLYIGTYLNEIDAARAYNLAVIQYLGDYAYQNPIPSHYESQPIYRKPRFKSNSKYRGVRWLEKVQKWEAGVFLNRKRIYIGRFFNLVDALLAWNAANIKYGGLLAYQNPIP
jgi:AP2 domain